MKFGVYFIVCAIAVLPKKFDCFDFLRQLLFPRFPVIQRVRYISEEARAIGDELAVLDTVGLVEKYGYPAEQHNVTTEDGYRITFFRIPGRSQFFVRKRRPVVFLQHGVFASSDSWVLLGPNNDLAFLLANAGYDVWLGNVRGNSYGRSHIELSPENSEFWNFSFHEIGMWDLPKMIDYALEYTNQKTLIYIGHSMGTTAAFVLLSQRPEYNSKIRLFINLAPIAMWRRPMNPVAELVIVNGDSIKKYLDNHGIYELGPQTRMNVRLGRTLCGENSVTLPLCATVYFLLAGNDPNQLNSSTLSHILSYVPAGASVKTLFHYHQNIVSGTFQPLDRGYFDNMKVYGKKKPPIYDLKKISARTVLIYGKNDLLAGEKNTFDLAQRLRNVVTVEAVPYESFNHLDFVWAINAKELLFMRVLELMSIFSM